LRETRLYVFPNEKEKVFHLLMIGGKSGQSADIKRARQLVKEIKKRGK